MIEHFRHLWVPKDEVLLALFEYLEKHYHIVLPQEELDKANFSWETGPHKVGNPGIKIDLAPKPLEEEIEGLKIEEEGKCTE